MLLPFNLLNMKLIKVLEIGILFSIIPNMPLKILDIVDGWEVLKLWVGGILVLIKLDLGLVLNFFISLLKNTFVIKSF